MIAAIANFITKKVDNTLTRSSILSLSLDTLYQLLLKSNKVTPIPSYYDAMTILDSLGIKVGKKNRQVLVKALEVEDISMESVGKGTEIEEATEGILAAMEG